MSKNTGTSELINYFDLGANGDVGIAGSLDVNTIANATTDTDKFLVSDTGIIKYRTGAELLTDIGAAPATGGSYLPLAGGTMTGSFQGVTGSNFVGTSVNSRLLVTASGVANTVIGFNNSGSTTDGVTNNTAYLGVLQDFPLVFTTNSIERLRIAASTGAATFSIPRTSGTDVNILTLSDNVTGIQTSGFGVRILATSNNGQAKSAIAFEANGGTNNDTAIAFYTQTSSASLDRRMTIDKFGNVGIGTAFSPVANLEVKGTGPGLGAGINVPNIFVSGASGFQSIGFRRDADTNGGWFIGTSHSVVGDFGIYQNQGASVPSNRLSISTSGNVLIGRTSDAGVKLDVLGTARISGNSTYAEFSLQDNTASGSTWFLLSGFPALGDFTIREAGVANHLVIKKTSGNVGIGTDTPSRKLQVVGAGTSTSGDVVAVRNDNSVSGAFINFLGGGNNAPSMGAKGNDLVFTADNYSGAELMRITSVGKTLLLGSTTSPWANSTRSLLELNNTGSVMLGLRISGNERAYFYHNNSNLYIENMLNPGSIYVISVSGGVYLTAGGTSWTSNSDGRLKNINGNIENAVDKLMTLRAVNFSWKNDKSKKENLGLIAQDVEKVFPQVIDINKLPSKPNQEQEDETEYLGVRYQDLIPVLIKAIQEQQVQIDKLKNA